MSDANVTSTGFGIHTRKGLATRGLSAVLAIAVLSSSSLAFAQAKPAAPKPAAAKPAPAAKPAAAKPAPAAKPGDKKAAGAAFKKGKDAFEAKDWKTAKEEFAKADEILPAPAAQYYLARSHEELGEGADAAKMYEKAIESGKLKEEQSADAKTRLEALKKKPAKVKVTSDPPGASILVDGKAIPEKTPAEIELPPGTHKITLKAEGRKDNEQSVEVAAFVGGSLNATLEEGPAKAAEPVTPPPPPPTTPTTTTTTTSTTTATVTPDTGKKDMTWVYVTGGAAIVALGVGTFFGLQATSDKSKFDDAVAAGQSQEARDARDSGTRNALISDMGFGIGITLAVTSAVLFFTRPSSDEPKAASLTPKKGTMSFAPIAGPSVAGMGARFEF